MVFLDIPATMDDLFFFQIFMKVPILTFTTSTWHPGLWRVVLPVYQGPVLRELLPVPWCFVYGKTGEYHRNTPELRNPGEHGKTQ